MFLGKSNNSEKSKSLATTNSKKANGVEASKGTVVKIVPSRKEHQVRKDSFLNTMEMFNSFFYFQAVSPSSSHSSDSGVGETRRRSLENGETIPSSQLTNPNGFSVVSTEDVKPDPGGLSNSAQFPTINGLGQRGLKKRDEDFKVKRLPDATKLKSLRKRKVPPVITLVTSEESSSEDENPIRYFMFLSSFQ